MGCGARLCVCIMFSTASLFGAHADRVPTEEVETLRDLAVREGIATIEDIAYWFSSVDEAAEAGLGHSWTLAKTLARVNPAGMASIASASRAQLVPTAPPHDCRTGIARDRCARYISGRYAISGIAGSVHVDSRHRGS